MNTSLIDFVMSMVSLIGLILLWRYAWRPYTLMRLRHDLFTTRDTLFDLAMRGENGLSFESEFYRKTRDDLNSMLRFCHHLSMTHLLVNTLLCSDHIRLSQEVANAKKRKLLLSEEQLQILRKVDRKQFTALQRYMLQSSPLLLVSLLVATFWFLPVAIFKGVKRRREFVTHPLTGPLVKQAEYEAGQTYLIGNNCIA